MEIILGILALLMFSGGNNYVFPLVDKRRYYLPKSLKGAGIWLSTWNMGYERGYLHAGIDFLPLLACNKVSELEKHPVLAFASGKVEFSGYTAWGWIVLIRHSNTMQTQYLHLYRSDVKVGDYVNAGQKIGIIGWEGSRPNNIQTSHLHFEVRINGKVVNPVPYLQKSLNINA